jgi:hypothetical protein
MTEYEFKLTSCGVTVVFTEYSGIEFWSEYGDDILTIDPTELSIIYGAYQNMLREEREKNIDTYK